jgi:hypothetical protein
VEHSASGGFDPAQHGAAADQGDMTRMHAATCAVLVLLAVAAQCAPASAGGPKAPGAASVEGTSTAQATGDGATATATASCPPGTKATGGGFDAPSSNEVMGLVYESVKVGQRAWRASMQVFDRNAPSTLTLTSYVYCAKRALHTKTVTSTAATDGQVQLGPTVSASCPDGRPALAGGFRMPPPLVSPLVTDLFFDSARSGGSRLGIWGWDTRVITGPAGPSTVTGEAYCGTHGEVALEATGSSALNNRDSTTSTATADCPAGLSPTAGGFSQPDSGAASFFLVYASRRVGDSWQIRGLHSGTEPGVGLNGFAYCT